MNSNGSSVRIILHLWFKAVLFFFNCICKITYKPMGNFAENLNLDKRVLPTWVDRPRVPIYWEFGHGGASNFCPWRHFVSKMDTSLYSKSIGNSCQLSYNCGPLENEAVKPIKSTHIWKANTITIPNMDMSVSVYRVVKKHIGCNIKNTEICRFLYWRRSFLTFLVYFQQNH